jgi:phospholipase D1/2
VTTPAAEGVLERAARVRQAARVVAGIVWAGVALLFWWGARASEAGGLADVVAIVDAIATTPWAPLAVLALYVMRPLLLLPITVVNLSAGFVLGAPAGLVFALIGTLASASVGYALGRFLGPATLALSLARRWPLIATLERHAFASVAAGGFMYLHADAVNLPAGLMRVRYRVFLAGIAVGNALTMSSAVLAGASLDQGVADAAFRVDVRILVLAAALFAASLLTATLVRRRRLPPSTERHQRPDRHRDQQQRR